MVYKTLLLKKCSAELDIIITGNDDYQKDVFNAEKGMLELRKPNIWNVNVAGNMEVETEVEFEKFLASLSEYTNEDFDTISVFKFYSLIEMLKEKHKSHGSNN